MAAERAWAAERGMGSPGLIQLGAVDLKSQNVRTPGVCSQRDGMAALRGCELVTPGCLVSYSPLARIS